VRVAWPNECVVVPMLATCAGCHRVIFAGYVTALGQTWHPEHFTCRARGQVIDSGSFVAHDQAAYHERCYRDHVLPKCRICAAPITGAYVADSWSNVYCARHAQEHPSCEYCRRLVCQALTNGGLRYPDGRVVCNWCVHDGVFTDERAEPLALAIAAWMRSEGLVADRVTLQVQLLDVPSMAKEQAGYGTGAALGLAVKKWQTVGGQEVGRRVTGIRVLWGLPRDLFEGVMAHEITHAWLFVNHVDNLPDWQEEGFCNLVMDRLYATRNTPEARYHRSCLERDPDPVYGVGFRRVRGLLSSMTFQGLVSWIVTNRRLPPIP